MSLGGNDDCFGYLIGEEHKGLKYMFTLMNEARIGIGMMAAEMSAAAYYGSLEYAKECQQGRQISSKDPSTSQIPIIEHADVKRMLLFQRAIINRSLSLLFMCSKLSE
ncbi:MAG: hypothetical protein SWO11_20690 [Thermodesulfobacteriota bacterium]|nr:hypothetical protein [Thermodesulfobacteriota bacterium]